MKLIYNVEDKPKFGQLVVFALQQLLAIMAATLVVPVIVNGSIDGCRLNSAAALFGAGVGTIVYILFTKKQSPVFLGSSFAFIGSMCAAMGGAASMAAGYIGLIIGAGFAGLVYVIISILVKCVGVKWISYVMPPVVIGPTVAIIGLSLASNAIGDLTNASGASPCSPLISVLCGIVTLVVIMICSVYGKKSGKLIPFIYGILAGYAFSSILTIIGNTCSIDALKVVDYSSLTNLFSEGVKLSSFLSIPDFTFILGGTEGLNSLDWQYIVMLAVAYVPVAFVVFAEHIADHKNLSSIIERDLLEKPGLARTLLGDGIGSVAGAIFGVFFGSVAGCSIVGFQNKSIFESIGCVPITKNASVYSIIYAAVGAILISFISPFVAFVNSIPSCVMGGACMALYGFIAVSGLKMIKDIDLDENRNLFVVSAILIAGVGGLTLTFGNVTLTEVAAALILGIIINLILGGGKKSRTADKCDK